MKIIVNNKCLNVDTREEAEKIAEEENLDLVEIADGVYKVMDYGKYHFEQQKKKKENKSKPVIVKELQISCVIAKADLIRKANTACGWIDNGYFVRVKLRFRGRELGRAKEYMPILEELIDYICDNSSVQSRPDVVAPNTEAGQKDAVVVVRPSVRTSDKEKE